MNGNKRLTVGIRAAEIPEETSQNASLRVVAVANGVEVGCTVNVQVTNRSEDTGW